MDYKIDTDILFCFSAMSILIVILYISVSHCWNKRNVVINFFSLLLSMSLLQIGNHYIGSMVMVFIVIVTIVLILNVVFAVKRSKES